jgi:hypothetical protein
MEDSPMPTPTIGLIIVAVLFLHGIAHLGALAALWWVNRFGGNAGGWLSARSWLFPSLAAKSATWLASAFWVLSTMGFVAAALSFWGVLIPAALWRPLAIGSAILSGTGIVLFLGRWPVFNTTAALAVNFAVVAALLWLNWPPLEMFAR